MMADLAVSVPWTYSSSPSICKVSLSKIHSDFSPRKAKETAMPGQSAPFTALETTDTPGIRAEASPGRAEWSWPPWTRSR
jgi:hypothetical protein